MRGILFLCLLLSALCTEAKPRMKKARVPAVLLQCDSAAFTYRKSGVRLIGHVYSFHVRTLVPGVQIDSVWFGAAPVPCDVYDARGVQCDTLKKKGVALLKANRDLYRMFPDQTDSTEVARNFRPPFPFRSEAVLMYRYKGKRYYLPVNGIGQRYDPRPYR
jgi:hypothetical protein